MDILIIGNEHSAYNKLSEYISKACSHSRIIWIKSFEDLKNNISVSEVSLIFSEIELPDCNIFEFLKERK